MNGSETLGWSQSAPTRTELDAYEYAAYVDGQRVAMPKPACSTVDSQTYDCRAPLPRMSIGRHALELTASLNGLESARSPAIQLTVDNPIQAVWGGAVLPSRKGAQSVDDQPAVHAPPRERACFGSAGECYEVDRISTSLDRPHALASLPDGRLVVVEGDARVVAFGSEDASQLQIDGPCGISSRSRINAIAVDPLFQESRFIYLAWTCEAMELPRELLVVRYRELNGTLGEAAPVVDEPAPATSDAFLAMTRNGRLVIASEQRDGWRIERVTTDGRTPPENANASRVVLRRRSVTALATDRNGDRVMFATGEGRIESLGLSCGTVGGNAPAAAVLGIDSNKRSIFFATTADRETLQRASLSAPECAANAPTAAADFDFGAPITAIAVGPDGSVAVLTRSTGSLFRLRPASQGK